MAKKQSRTGKVIVTESIKLKPKKSIVKRKNNRSRSKNTSRSSGGGFSNFLRAPSLYGPTRIPREGGNIRTILGMDKSLVQLTGNTTNIIQAAIALPQNIGGLVWETGQSTSSTTALTHVAEAGASLSFPPVANLDDANMISCEFVLSYLGAPQTCTGELLIGSVAIDQTFLLSAGLPLTSMDYATTRELPTVLHVALSELLIQPLHVWMTKGSPVSNEFKVTTGASYSGALEPPDCYWPVIMTTGQASGAILNVDVTRTFECRSSSDRTEAVPYAVQSTSHSSDLNRYQDIISDMGTSLIQVGPYLSAAKDAVATFGNQMSATNLNLIEAGPASLAGQMLSNMHLSQRGSSRDIHPQLGLY